MNIESHSEKKGELDSPHTEMFLWAQRIFVVGLFIFLILLIKMAPGVGDLRFLTYVGCALVVILFSVIFFKQCKKSKSQKTVIVMILLAILLNLTALGLRLIYESKYPSAIAYLPPSGVIYVKMLTTEEYYSSNKEGSIYKPSVSLRLDDVYHDRNTTFAVKFDHNYNARIGCSYIYNGVVDGAYIDDLVVFKRGDYKNLSLVYNKTINVSSTDYAKITLNFKRVMGFWDVIFF